MADKDEGDPVQLRTAILRFLRDARASDRAVATHEGPAAEHFGMSRLEMHDHMLILESEGCLNLWYLMGQIAESEITGRGLLRLEGQWEPSTLDRSGASRAGSQIINVSGGVTNIGNVGPLIGGSVIQTSITNSVELARLMGLLDQLSQEMRSLGATDEEQTRLVRSIDDLRTELQQPSPGSATLRRGWGTLKTLATFEGVWAGWDRARNLAEQAEPILLQLLQGQSGPIS